MPLPALNGKDDKRGVYELSLPRDWFVKAAPFLKVLTGTLALVVPVASSATKLVLDDATYKDIEKQLDFGQKSLDSVLKGSEKAAEWLAARGQSLRVAVRADPGPSAASSLARIPPVFRASRLLASGPNPLRTARSDFIHGLLVIQFDRSSSAIVNQRAALM